MQLEFEFHQWWGMAYDGVWLRSSGWGPSVGDKLAIPPVVFNCMDGPPIKRLDDIVISNTCSILHMFTSGYFFNLS